MTDHDRNNNGVAPLRNVAALATLIERLHGRDPGLPGMGVFFGPAGWGKSYAAIYATNRFQAITVQVKSVTTRKDLCLMILSEMGITPRRVSLSALVDQISEQLAITDVPLIIDEVDHLMTRQKIELVRDIYEGSGGTVVLIGEEQLPQKLKQWERVHGRIRSWVPAEPGTLEDVRVLSKYYAAGITFDEDFYTRLLRGSGQSIRRICANLATAKEAALIKGVTKFGVDDWGSKSFFDGQAPAPRRGVSA